MRRRLVKFFQSWAINTLAVALAVKLIPGIHCSNSLNLFIAALFLGILNSLLKPFLTLLALPLLIFTLGLFMFVINALILYFVGFLLQPWFYVDGFWAAFKGALVISVVSLLLNLLTGGGGTRAEFRRGRRPPDDEDRGGGGPVIDV